MPPSDIAETIPDDELIQALTDKGLLDPAAMTQFLAGQQEASQQAGRDLSGTAFIIEPAERRLRVEEVPAGKVLKEISLNTFHDVSEAVAAQYLKAGEWGTHWSLVNGEDGTAAGLQPMPGNGAYGLVSAEEQVYVYAPAPLETQNLALTGTLLCNRVAPRADRPVPIVDLAMADDGSFLCLSDRMAGTLTLLSTRSLQPMGTVQVRLPGSPKAINMAIDSARRRVYMTDNKSLTLYVLEVDTLYIQKLDIGLHALGNIALAPGGKHLFVISLKPSVGLRYLNLKTMEIEKSLKLKGDLFSLDSIDPCDLMTMTPDGNHLLVMTYINEPQPFTPVISVLETGEVKTVRRYAIKDNKKPALLAVAYENPAARYTRGPLALLEEAGMVAPADVEALRQELLAARRRAAEEAAGIRELSVEEVGIGKAAPLGPPKAPALEPQSAEKVALPQEQAIPALLTLLTERFYQASEIDIQQHPDELARFKNKAEEIRAFLETHDGADVLLEGILGEYKLEFLLKRQEVLNLIELQALKDAIKKQEVVTAPTHCPNCRQALNGSWDCDSCGLELESPERALKRSLSSAEPTANLAQFHLGLPDPQGQRLLMLDGSKTLTWELKDGALAGCRPWDAIWLPNRNILVADRESSRVFECSPTGKLLWQAAPEQPLQHPVKVTYFSEDGQELFLIVDQGNHRVLALDRAQKTHWQYGEPGIAGRDGYLSSPSDVQFTYDRTYLVADTGNDRVIEIERGEVNRSFGKEAGLAAPVFAQRLFNGHTLIVDAGNSRVVELDSQGGIVQECFYFTEDISEDMRITRPIKAIRRQNRTVIVMDQDKILELMPAEKKLVWFSPLTHLSRLAELKDESEPMTRKRYVKSFYEYRLPTLEELEKLLKGESPEAKKTNLPLQAIQRLKALIEKRAELREEQERKTARKASATLTPGAEVADIPIFCLDRTYHLALRIDRQGQADWHFGTDPRQRLLRPHHLLAADGAVWVADTGHEQVVAIGLEDREVMLTLKGELSQPRSAWPTRDGGVLVADQGHRRLVELGPDGRVKWEFKNMRDISGPYWAEELPGGTILFADWGLHMVKEIDRRGQLLWSYGQMRKPGKEANQLSYPEFATRLPNGHTLIADTRNHRVLEIAPGGGIAWEYQSRLKNPLWCQRLEDGHTLIAGDNYRQLVEVDSEGQLLWRFQQGNEPMVALAEGEVSIFETESDTWKATYSAAESQRLQQALAEGRQGWEIHIRLMKDCQMKAIRITLILMALEGIGEVLRTFPSREQLQAEQFGTKIVAALLTGASAATVRDTVAAIAEVAGVELSAMA